ncbi:hypothetical protein E2562_027726 [Oryza meyeriana var. granulata]|uniref:Uncharacterized protein n=1 Tax=Oryza meyeriana var. granulata TaxID=110450 RepID=A0A6G1EQF8_9ORYZ|nr:hypothetical protein E2562_027726 [Oryza meyeriana var. granulata]
MAKLPIVAVARRCRCSPLRGRSAISEDSGSGSAPPKATTSRSTVTEVGGGRSILPEATATGSCPHLQPIREGREEVIEGEELSEAETPSGGEGLLERKKAAAEDGVERKEKDEAKPREVEKEEETKQW